MPQILQEDLSEDRRSGDRPRARPARRVNRKKIDTQKVVYAMYVIHIMHEMYGVTCVLISTQKRTLVSYIKKLNSPSHAT